MPLSVSAAAKDGVGLSKISLPSGPGSIEGLGDSFEPQLNTGTSAYSVKVAIPPGVAGLQPSVVLRYNAGAGNGPFGLAWSWSPMTIQRQTEKGLPTYTASDVFTLDGEELVPLEDGSYRVENESGFMRITQSGEGWEVRDKAGTVYRIGMVTTSRQSRPGGGAFTDTFKWCLNEQVDVHGNRMEFDYATFPDSPGQLYCTEIRYSISRADPAVFHSVIFDYEPRADAFSSFLSGFEITTGRRCREIRVLSQGGLVRRYGLSYELPPNEPIEPVSFGDAGLTFSLLRRVTQFDNRTGAQSAFLPPLQFGYTRMDAADGALGEVSNAPPLSLADPAVAFADINCDSLPDLLHTDPWTGQHTVYYNLGHGAFGDATPFTSYPWPVTLDTLETELADYDGDGRVDLVQKSGDQLGRFVFYRNTTLPSGNNDAQPRWGQETSFQGPFPPFALNDPSVRTLDLDGDKRMDFMRTTGFGFVYFYNRTNQWQQDGLHLFGEPAMGDIGVGDGVQFSQLGGGGDEPNPLVKLADMNGDRLLDLVKLTVAGTQLEVVFWPNRGRASWGNRKVMTGTINLGVIPFEDAFVMDLNGDGLSDIVAVGYDHIKYWINRGNGSFSPEFTRSGMPTYIRGQTVLRQADINGNGSTDFLWENWEPSLGRTRIQFYDFLATAKPNLLRVIDNGIGLRTEIEYRTSTDYYVAARAAGNPWTTRLPFPSTVVSKITKRFGLDLDAVPGPDEYITEFGYHNGYYDGFEKEFRGFAFAKKIERGDDSPLLGGEGQGEGERPIHSPTTVTRFAFHTGTPDEVDNNGDGRFDEFDEVSGYEEEALKGKVLWTEVTLPTADIGGSYPAQLDGQPADDAVVFTRQYQTWKIKTIHHPEGGFTYRDALGLEQAGLSLPHATMDGKKISFAYLADQTTEFLEANGALAGGDPFMPVRPMKQTHTQTDVDFFGNTLFEKNYGEHSPGSTYDDERFAYNLYAFNLADWLIGLSARSWTTDENGIFVSESRKYYDGADFVGLPLGQIGQRGLLMREEASINGSTLPPALDDTPAAASNQVGDPRLPANAFIQSSRNRYDAYGNPVATRDPLWTASGQGHERRYEFDPVFNSYVEREIIEVGGTNANLVATATYDYGGAIITGFTDFNGNATSYQYDSFYRLVGIVKPGDTLASPTQTFSYRPGDIFRGLYYHYDPAGNLTLENTANPHVVSAVSTRAREQAGTANTFDVTAYTDGAGHKLGVAEEGEIAGQFIYKDVKRYTSRGHERSAYLPFRSNDGEYRDPPGNIAHVDMFYDAAGRVIRSVNPPESHAPNAPQGEARTVYLPLETRLFDEEDTNPGSKHFNTPHVQYKDGLDRLLGVDEVVKLTDLGEDQATAAAWATRYQYDLQDKLTRITDSQGNQKWFRYDGLGRKIFMNDPDRGVMFWTYDNASNLTQTRDAKNQVIAYTYDGVNRLKTEDYQDSASPEFSYNRTPDVLYHYDYPAGPLNPGDNSTVTAANTRGYLSWVEDASGEEHTSYDARSRVGWVVKRIRDPQHGQLVNFRTGFNYDSLDRLTKLQYADNDEIKYAYNPRNLTQRIFGDIAGNIVSNITYIETDQLRTIDYGNGVRTSYDYDPRQRLTRLHTLAPPRGDVQGEGLSLIDFAYTFDRVSNILRIDDQRPGSAVPEGDKRRNTQIFDYDNLYRLTRAQYSFNLPGQADRNDGSIVYRYDRIGNMMKQTSDITHVERGLSVTDLGQMDSGGTAGRHNRLGRPANAQPGPHALTRIIPLSAGGEGQGEVVRNYTYDPNGNMTFLDGMTNTWDFKDRLVAVENAEMRAEYRYDYTDRRIWKRVHWRTASTNNVTGANPGYVLYPNKSFELREGETPVKYVWNGDTRVARVTRNLNNDNVRIQRFKLSAGWNLMSLAVTATNAFQQLSNSISAFSFQLSAFRWEQSTDSWLTISPNETLPAGTVLWLKAATNITAQLMGAYAEPTNRIVTAGTSFQPGAGLEPLNLQSAISNLPSSSLWKFDGANQSWLIHYDTNLQLEPDSSLQLAVGDSFMARVETSTTLDLPEAKLQVRYYHTDHLGSSTTITAIDGSAIQQSVSYPFGQARSVPCTSATRDPYSYTQKELDRESDLHYFQARYLRSTTGRFASVDLAGFDCKTRFLASPQELNPYSYCSARVTIGVDPSGRTMEIPVASLGLVGAIVSPFLPSYMQSIEVPTSVSDYNDFANATHKYLEDWGVELASEGNEAGAWAVAIGKAFVQEDAMSAAVSVLPGVTAKMGVAGSYLVNTAAQLAGDLNSQWGAIAEGKQDKFSYGRLIARMGMQQIGETFSWGAAKSGEAAKFAEKRLASGVTAFKEKWTAIMEESKKTSDIIEGVGRGFGMINDFFVKPTDSQGPSK
ncbi:MAG: VCBS repeat-containing protein [Verrucomicrobia bacterium]|nr:VCBS repeat-containing protein [Verrucomicrobiota bacterium]